MKAALLALAVSAPWSRIVGCALRQIKSHSTHDSSDLAIELAHARLAGVVTNDASDCRLFELNDAVANPRLLSPLWNQVFSSDAKLLGLGVTRHFHDL